MNGEDLILIPPPLPGEAFDRPPAPPGILRRDRRLRATGFWARHSPPWLASAALHTGIVLLLALVTVATPLPGKIVSLFAEPVDAQSLLDMDSEFAFAELDDSQPGVPLVGEGQEMLAIAPLQGPLPNWIPDLSLEAAGAQPAAPVENRITTGMRPGEKIELAGVASVGASGTVGAVDRITEQILLSLQQRPTLVVWFFDQSGSLAGQRAEIVGRFDRIYDELGRIEKSGNQVFGKHADKPLLSSVVAFGQDISFLTNKPTDKLDEIKSAVRRISTDDSGVERTFEAVFQAATRYRSYRTSSPLRNVMFVIFTDEVGDDEESVDRDITLLRRLEIPLYCVGVPAPFGRRNAMVKYIDPDPQFDQSPQWIPVRQGPESFRPELVNLGDEQASEAIDSGFGPFGLTRLCFETGGMFFAVHPNRERGRGNRRDTPVLTAQISQFFDPEVMRAYRPDYVPIKEYQRLLAENRARRALVEAAELSWAAPLERPELYFPKRSDAELANRLSRAQQAAAVVEPRLQAIYATLQQGEKDRARLSTPRWQAGYDLSMGRVLAALVRAEGYNTMLAQAKNGMEFKESTSDTWRLTPSNEVTATAALAKMAQQATDYLSRVAREHPRTPWAAEAERELKQPMGWTWRELYSGASAPARQVAANNQGRRQPQDDKARNIPRPEKRAVPKL